MNLSKTILLWMSENTFLKNKIPNLKFVRKAVKRFMPGETETDAIITAKELLNEKIQITFTKLGENITQIHEAEKVRDHYLKLIDTIKSENIDVELSIKLTQLGFDLSENISFQYCKEIAESVQQKLGNTLFIDMEGSAYTQRTINFYKKLKERYNNIGLCLQAYLYRTKEDLLQLIDIDSQIRLVKGAYRESADIAFPKKADVDKNYFELAKILLENIHQKDSRVVFGTHDEILIEKMIKEAKYLGIQKDRLEFQMLYGIKNNYVRDLVRRGYKGSILIAYGESWYAWYMRRLAERPANVWFVLKSIYK